MKWIKASERLPNERKVYFVKVIHKNDDPRNTDCILKDTWLMENGKLVDTGFNQNDISWYKLVEWLDESIPSTGEDDMTAKEFFDSPESPITLDKICTPTEKEFLLDTIEMYANGKVNQALKAASTPPAKDNWIKIEEKPKDEKEYLVKFYMKDQTIEYHEVGYWSGEWSFNCGESVDIREATHYTVIPPTK